MISRNSIQNILLYFFFFSLNFEVWDPINTGGNFSIARLTGLLYGVSLLPYIGTFIEIPNKFKKYFYILLLFYCYNVLINIINVNILTSDFLFFSLFQNIIIFWLLFNHERLSPGVLESGFISFLLGSLFFSVFYFLNIGVEINSEGRISLFGDNENIIGIRMVVSAFVLTHVIYKYKKRILSLIFFLLPLAYIPFVLIIVNTGSRLSFISLILGISTIFLIVRNRSIILKFLILLFGIFVSIYLVELAMKSEVMATRITKTISEGHFGGREEIWQTIFPLIKDNWVFGVGRTGYIDYVTRIYGTIKSPHNVFLEVFAYSGIIGFSLLVSFIALAFFESFKYLRRYNAVIPFIFFVPILGILFSAQILTFKLGWVIFAYSASRIYYLSNSFNENSLRN